MAHVCKSEPNCLSFEEDQNVRCCLPGIQILHLVSVPTKFSFKCLSENTLVVSNFLMLPSFLEFRQSKWIADYLKFGLMFLIFVNYLTMQINLFFWNVFKLRRALSKDNSSIFSYYNCLHNISKIFWWCRKFNLELAVIDFTHKLGIILTPKLYCEVKSREVSSLIQVDFAQSWTSKVNY